MLKRINKTILIICLIFLIGLSLRLIFAPSHNLSSDPFLVITSAKTLAETGNYLVPEVGYSDLGQYNLPPWPVGFPLLLSTLFKVFGYSEILARLFTIFLTSLVIIFTGVISHLLFKNRYITWLSTLLVALNPLLVAFSGRIHTQNGAFFFLLASITFLLLSVVKRDNLGFANPEIILRDKRRLSCFLLSIFLAGFLLTVRETEAIYGLAFVYILYKAGFSLNKKTFYLILLGIIPFILGYSPSLYYNYMNYGSFITSTHLYWGGGIPLDIHYLFFGSSGSMGLPGGLVILLSTLAYAFPLSFLLFVKKFNGNIRFLLMLFLLSLLPVIFLYGSAVPVGAAPRYILPLIPIASIIAAYSILNIRKMKKTFYIAIISIVSLQQLFLFSPPPLSFNISPKIGLATVYSPVYNIYSYNNFPDHTNAMVEWVKNNTESNAIIITPSRVSHFYYYAKRDAIHFTAVTASLTQALESRPVYLVQDHGRTVDPEEMDIFLKSLDSFNLTYKLVDQIPLFSPYIGSTQMRIYRVEKK